MESSSVPAANEKQLPLKEPEKELEEKKSGGIVERSNSEIPNEAYMPIKVLN